MPREHVKFFRLTVGVFWPATCVYETRSISSRNRSQIPWQRQPKKLQAKVSKAALCVQFAKFLLRTVPSCCCILKTKKRISRGICYSAWHNWTIKFFCRRSGARNPGFYQRLLARFSHAGNQSDSPSECEATTRSDSCCRSFLPGTTLEALTMLRQRRSRRDCRSTEW